MAAVSPEMAQAIEAAFDAAQTRTDAPLTGMVAESSGEYAAAPLALSLCLALVAPWPLLLLTHISAERIFAFQLAIALIALALFSLPRLRVALSGKRARRSLAHRAAMLQFASRVGGRPGGENGVLIYVSLAEHYVRVVAGHEAARLISASHWQGLVDRLTADIAKGELPAAMGRAAAEAADMLAPHFPPSPNTTVKGARFHSA
jgi:putative membrane protein